MPTAALSGNQPQENDAIAFRMVGPGRALFLGSERVDLDVDTCREPCAYLMQDGTCCIQLINSCYARLQRHKKDLVF